MQEIQNYIDRKIYLFHNSYMEDKIEIGKSKKRADMHNIIPIKHLDFQRIK